MHGETMKKKLLTPVGWKYQEIATTVS